MTREQDNRICGFALLLGQTKGYVRRILEDEELICELALRGIAKKTLRELGSVADKVAAGFYKPPTNGPSQKI